MLTYSIDRNRKAMYLSLYDCIRKDIISGTIKAGDRLPSKRSFAQHLGVSVITVENAYACLISEGYIESREKKGYFAAKIMTVPEPVKTENNFQLPENRAYKIDLRSGSVDTRHFPVSVWNRISRKVITEREGAILLRCPGTGTPELRSAIADYLRRNKGVDVSPDCILIGAGTDVLLNILVRLLGAYRIFGVEDPGYRKITAVYRSSGVRCIPLPSDGEGISMEALLQSPVQALHISPNHQYPTGRVTSAGRRFELLKWAAENPDRYIIEDDYDSELRFDAKPLGSMLSEDRRGSVIYLNTFSRTISPGLRIGYLVLPSRLMTEFAERFRDLSCTVSTFEQLSLAEFIAGGYYERYIGKMRRIYRQRREMMFRRIAEKGLERFAQIREETAGLHFLLKMNTPLSEDEIRMRAEEQGIGVSFLSECCNFHREETARYLIVNYAGLNPEDDAAVIDFFLSVAEPI